MILEPVRCDGHTLSILDQTLLPWEERFIDLQTREDLWEAIHALRVRGAPAIGIAAAFGLAVLAKGLRAADGPRFSAEFGELSRYLASSRPTAVNLFWAIARMEETLDRLLAQADPCMAWEALRETVLAGLMAEARAIRQEDEDACRAMGELGLSLLSPGMGILTYCNAGTIATARYGTSLAPLYLGHERDYGFKIFACETRPLMQGARLTSWELSRAGMDVTLLCDNMAASAMQRGLVQAVLVGCDRMAANGDGANKIGTAGLAILAREFGIPFYMFVPASTIDLGTATGADIPVEERAREEVTTTWFAREMAPSEVKVFNPAFDVTDHRLITAVVTERGILRPPFGPALRDIVHGAQG
jgi:methylthioribose-1-phosphate isomerase